MAKRLSRAALVGFCLLATPLAALAQHAAEPAPAGDAHAAPAAHAPGGGHGDENKPALLQFDPGAMIWTIVVFLGLLFVLRVAAWKPILRALNEREQFIHKSLADAKHEREQAEKLLAEHRVQLDQARDEAAAIVAEGRRDAEDAARRIQEAARKESDDAVDRARREIQLATDSARKELHDQAAELAVLVARRIIGKELSAADHRQLVEESLAQMQAQSGQPGRMN